MSWLTILFLGLAGYVPTLHAQTRWRVDQRPLVVVGPSSPAGATPLGEVTGAHRRPDGSLVVADGTAPALRFFDPEGRMIASAGRAGGGPGEYRVISWMGRCGGDSLAAYDLYQRKFSIVDNAGRFVRHVPAPGDAAAISCADDGSIAIVGSPSSAQGADRRVRARVSMLTRAGEARVAIPDVPFYEMTSASGVPLLNPLGPTTTIALGRERIFVATGTGMAIDAYDLTGRELAALAVPGTRRRPTEAHRAASVSEFLRFTTDLAMRRAMEAQLANLPLPDALPPYSAVLVDSERLPWVHRSVPGDVASDLSVLSQDGRWVADVRIPSYVRIFEVGRDYIVGANLSDDGEPQVSVWRLRRG